MAFAETAGLTVWLTGLSSSGKSTIAGRVVETLGARGERVEWLDGDVVRKQLSADLGFSKADRDENIRRIGRLAARLTEEGALVIVSAISPYRAVREEVRQGIGNFLEVWVHAPLAVCEGRDRKGIYRRARAGELTQVTGIDDPYEEPLAADVECRTDRESLEETAAKVLRAIAERRAGYGECGSSARSSG